MMINRGWIPASSALLICLSACATAPVLPPDHAPISDGVRALAEVKSQSEQWTRKLKQDFLQGTEQRKKAEALYIPAKAAIDAWIAALKTELIEDRGGISPQHQALMQQAASKGSEYVVYVNQLYVKGAVAAATPLIGDLLKLLPDMGFKIWKDYQDAARKRSEEAKKKILEQLDTLKWDFFDKV